MPKAQKSQWDFGELFSPEATRRVFTVTELTLTVRRLIEGQVGRVWVSGEITNFRLQSSGHSYFSIKDAGAQLNCVLFRDEARSIPRDALGDGQKVVLQGDMTVYEARGQYQLRVTTVELQGIGALQAAFERLKQKLNAEGLFAAERKRTLPRYAQRIGIVTSPTGAALRDVLHVTERRDSRLEVVLAPSRVQGQGAAEEIVQAIRLLNQWNEQTKDDPSRRLDLILLTRGGGSLEDLWAFNEEVVARAIFESKLPVVSAIGHEIDFTISDFVADLRAATPSAAAEIITEGILSSRQFVLEAPEHLRYLATRRLHSEQEHLTTLVQRLARSHPRQRLQVQAQRLDDLQSTLLRCARFGLRTHGAQLGTLVQRLVRVQPSARVARLREDLQRLQFSLSESVCLSLTDHRVRFEKAFTRLCLLSPANVLQRGYSMTLDSASGKILHRANDVRPGQRLRTILQTGEVTSVVEAGFPKPGSGSPISS